MNGQRMRPTWQRCQQIDPINHQHEDGRTMFKLLAKAVYLALKPDPRTFHYFTREGEKVISVGTALNGLAFILANVWRQALGGKPLTMGGLIRHFRDLFQLDDFRSEVETIPAPACVRARGSRYAPGPRETLHGATDAEVVEVLAEFLQFAYPSTWAFYMAITAEKPTTSPAA